MKISFFGGAQEVTGANYLLDSGKTKILVDCGLFQCPNFCSLENYQPFRYDPAQIDALLVTHAHIDHTGRIPKLIAEGFSGKIYSTAPTKDFAALMLEDSIGVLEKEAKNELREVYYREIDIKNALTRWETVGVGQSFTIGDMSVTVGDAGHVLGSSMYTVTHGEYKVLFSGDLGNSPNQLLPEHARPTGITHMLVESAYGDRIHEDVTERRDKLERVIEDTIKRGGVLMIPSFALERTQELLFELNELIEHGRIPSVPIFLDSPLAIKATAIYKKYAGFYNTPAREHMKVDGDLFQFPKLKQTLSSTESRAINNVPAPKIIIAGAGMMHGGRILHHAKRYLPDPKNTILFIGYLAANSLGRRIFEGAREVTIHKERIPVRATAKAIGGYSAHADHDALLEFVNHTRDTLQKVFVVQGELKAGLFLSQRIKDYLGVDSVVPKLGDSFEL